MVTLVSYYTDNHKYDKLLEVSVNSFKHFHKNDDYILKLTNKKDLDFLNINDKSPPGILKFKCAYQLAKKFNANKVIILGADTIICSRLDEFLDNDIDQILASQDYEYKIPLNIKNSTAENHVNADVVCFNDLKSLKLIIKEYEKNPHFFKDYYEQGALNYILFSGKFSITYKIVDSKSSNSKNLYNVRSKGRSISRYTGVDNSLNYAYYISKYKVIGDKLYTPEDHQIKVFHYAQGLGTFEKDNFEKIINYFTNLIFNNETKIFFTKISSTNFFNETFKL